MFLDEELGGCRRSECRATLCATKCSLKIVGDARNSWSIEALVLKRKLQRSLGSLLVSFVFKVVKLNCFSYELPVSESDV